jgi:hypothetical protein
MAIDEGTRSIINDLKIASPCPMLWNNMERTPEEAIRFCGECRKNVYDVSLMNANEVSLLLQKSSINGGSACMQLYRRADGTVITDDCPVGLKRVRDMWRRLKSAVAGLALVLTALPGMAQTRQTTSPEPTALKGKICPPNRTAGIISIPTPATPRGERGESAPLGGRSSVNVPMPGGAPAPLDWREPAMRVPSVKKLADRIESLKSGGNLSEQEKLNILRLRLEMSQEASKRNVPAFSRAELAETQQELSSASDTTDKNLRAQRQQLLKDILTARIANSKTLGIDDVDSLRDQLAKLKSAK